jgi:predicted anti-sigma-YlaC factor YlaD
LSHLLASPAHRWLGSLDLRAQRALLASPRLASLAIRAVVGLLVDVGLLGRTEEDIVLVLVSFGKALEDGSARGDQQITLTPDMGNMSSRRY